MFPERWHDYTQCGSTIEGTNIVCFKVPLNAELFAYVTDDEDKWTVERMLKQNPTMGAVIDLTNTNNKYYDGVHVKRAGLLYAKIKVPGHAVPSERLVQKFIDTVDEFTVKCPGMSIGVHCTHGVNRSGYMVCRYMMKKLKCAPQEAVDRFEKARGHAIERRNYMYDLFKTNY
ncbi:ORF-127 [Catopsilia pomona nucleopolyhedrovirus]|uniref:ORF-127 n=1 Tax=Catopsilia pomona nucleopolyhedrovirus TaxID=1850906 RepID=A0A172WZK3_9ABAC|nr:ORF-127 [Catopsilia pomona nucleopolyhedrovirus]ANF29775.1 ORF-127 [Catopsilia pomona nucleopolyhedrovirus]